MSKQYTIGRLARAAGIPTTTLRYYERTGLLEPEQRSLGNYRIYSDESFGRLKFIRAAQAIGFTLGDVKGLLGIHDGRTPTCREVQTLIEERLADIDKRLKDLRHVKSVLKSAYQKCQQTEQVGSCHVVETLREASLA